MDVQVVVVIPGRLADRASAAAQHLGITRSALVAEALEDFLDMHGDGHEEVDDGCDDEAGC